MERFLREARAAANLLHPHIVPVFDSGTDGPHRYIASAFVTGRSLDVVLGTMPEGQLLPVAEAVRIVRHLAEALAYAHRSGVVHRDIKPGNIMLREDGEPAIMDFGLAARADEERMTVAGQVLGTPAYMAPEQWRGQAEPSCDQYSLGCVLFELLTRQLPFVAQHSDVEHYMFLHLTQAPPSPVKFRAEVPRDVETICLKCLEKEPGKRYGDCQSLADDLRRWQEGEPITARRAGPGERLVKWTRRNPAVAGLLLLVLLTLAGGATVATVFGIKANEKAKAEANARQDAQRHEKQALAARDRSDAILPAMQVGSAIQAWKQNDGKRAQAILHQVEPRFLDTWEQRHTQTLLWRSIPLWSRNHPGPVTCVATSRDGKWIASAYGGVDRLQRTHACIHAATVLSQSLGRSLATVAGLQSVMVSLPLRVDLGVKTWEAQTGREKLTFRGHTGAVESVAFTPDGRSIVTGGADTTVKIWDSQTGQEILTLRGHTASVYSVAYSPDGRRIVSGSADCTVKIWDSQTGLEAGANGPNRRR